MDTLDLVAQFLIVITITAIVCAVMCVVEWLARKLDKLPW
jgi:preprotein translocase subunit SecE